MLLRLLSLPIDPTAGEVRSGIGGGPPIGAGRGPVGAGGPGISSVGLSPREENAEREVILPEVVVDWVAPGRQTF